MKLPLKRITAIGVVILFLFTAIIVQEFVVPASLYCTTDTRTYIKWVDFTPTYEVLVQAYEYDTISHNDPTYETSPMDWIELLAYVAAKTGGHFQTKRSKDMDMLVSRLAKGEVFGEIVAGMRYYGYYLEAYSAALGGLMGTENDERRFSAYSPVASGYSYSHSSDFGESRSYGYQRRHLGNDIFAQIGTPVVAVEDGVIEALGWNKYGGWRIGLRSNDGKRYYYYAHLRKNHPYHCELKEGDVVSAGQVIGYVGRTGYSDTENVNNIDTPHLHFGMQLIFDESQKESDNEIWIDVYGIVRLLSKHRADVVKDEQTKDYNHVAAISSEPGVNVPIIMYHSVLKDASKSGKYVIAPEVLENDLAWLKKNGYRYIVMADLIDYVYNGGTLPEKPVMITFDDGYYNNLVYAYPLLEKYDMKAVLSVVGSYTDSFSESLDRHVSYAHLTYEDLKLLQLTGRMELANHSYDMHGQKERKGSGQNKGESLQHYEKALTDDLLLLQARLLENTGTAPLTFTYPYGQVSAASLPIIKKLGFLASLSCYEKPNTVTRDPEGLYLLNRYNRPAGTSTEAFMQKATKAAPIKK